MNKTPNPIFVSLNPYPVKKKTPKVPKTPTPWKISKPQNPDHRILSHPHLAASPAISIRCSHTLFSLRVFSLLLCFVAVDFSGAAARSSSRFVVVVPPRLVSLLWLFCCCCYCYSSLPPSFLSELCARFSLSVDAALAVVCCSLVGVVGGAPRQG